MKVYLLMLQLDRNIKIEVGKLGKILFKKGYYVYIGSAKKGYHTRIPRYFKIKKKYWHIDYLLDFAKIIKIYLLWGREEELANKFAKKFEFIKNFGNSDKKDVSHLFYSQNKENLEKYIEKIIYFKLKKFLSKRDNKKSV